MGRVLLSGLSPPEIDGFFDSTVLSKPTPQTVVDPAALRAIIRKTAEQGFAIVDGELELGLISLAAPIFDSAGKVAAALNISSHTSRTTRRSAERDLLPPLLSAAKSISESLGHDRA
jgi:IclR family pca regulon transcriptional regulator